MNVDAETDKHRKRRLERVFAFLVGVFVIEFFTLPVIGVSRGTSNSVFYVTAAAFFLTGILLMWLSYRIRTLSRRDVGSSED